MLDRIRIEYMKKFHYHAGIAEAKFMGHIIIPTAMNELKQKTTGLEVNMTLCSGTTAEISYLDKEKREWRYPVDLEACCLLLQFIHHGRDDNVAHEFCLGYSCTIMKFLHVFYPYPVKQIHHIMTL